MNTHDTDVLVVGAGPTGLAAAVALVLHGVATTVVDRQAAGANTSRAVVVNARTLEVLEAFDVARRLVKEGVQAARFTIGDRGRTLIPVDVSGLPAEYPYSLMVSQATTERLLLERLEEMGGRVLRPKTLTALAEDRTGSLVRDQAQIGFDGSVYDESFVLADVRLTGRTPSDGLILYWAGDAAHVHRPAGGQGTNLGIQDTVALADALAAVLAGEPDTRLDEYSESRRPIAQEVVEMTDRRHTDTDSGPAEFIPTSAGPSVRLTGIYP